MMRLDEAVGALGARASGGDALFTGVSTDSRSLREGDLFVALRGERFDGHGFLKAAATAKAAAAMVDSNVPRRVPAAGAGRGGHEALARRPCALLARALRAGAGRRLPARTARPRSRKCSRRFSGSMQARRAVLATRGNLNNDIGLPLTLLAPAPLSTAGARSSSA